MGKAVRIQNIDEREMIKQDMATERDAYAKRVREIFGTSESLKEYVDEGDEETFQWLVGLLVCVAKESYENGYTALLKRFHSISFPSSRNPEALN